MASGIVVAGTNPDLEEVFRACGTVLRVPPDACAVSARTTSAADVLVVDLRGRPRLPPWVAEWKQSRPAMPVILVLAAADTGMMLAAMRAGIDECLIEPLSHAEAHAALARMRGERRRTAGEVFAFVGAKGGVGATTIAVNSAAALARLTGDVLFVDLNTAGGDAALMLGIEPRFSVIDAVENTHRADESFFRGLLADGPDGLRVLAAPASAFVRPLDENRLRALLEFVRSHYQYTVLDLPRTAPAALAAMSAAGKVVIIANQEVATLRSAGLLAAAAREAADVETVSLILNQYDRRAALESADVERAVGLPIAARFPSFHRQLVDAANAGELLGPRTEPGAMFDRFARDLGGLTEGTPARSLLSRMSASVIGTLQEGW